VTVPCWEQFNTKRCRLLGLVCNRVYVMIVDSWLPAKFSLLFFGLSGTVTN
jgi:hypothetical protein